VPAPPRPGTALAAVVRGHQAYYAVPGNSDAVNAFRTQVIRHWRTALRRRSQRTRLNWDRMSRIAARWIPQTRTVHPFPQARSAATHPR
jgi:RNA-directed DNA polymerase